MTIKEFIEELACSITAGTGKMNVIPTETDRTNGAVQHGLVLKMNDSNVAPIIYVDDMYRRYRAGEMSIESIARNVMRMYENLPALEITDVDAVMADSFLIDRITIRLVNGSKNMEMIERKGLVYHKVTDTDLVCVFYATIQTGDKISGAVAISNELVDRYLPNIVDGNMLYDEVVKRVSPDSIYLKSMVDVIEMMIKEKKIDAPSISLSEDTMYILTNRNMAYGASMILTEIARKKVLEIFTDGKVTILPSSVHELLLLHADENENIYALREMVKQVNSTEILPEDFLSDNIYHYDATNGKMEIAY